MIMICRYAILIVPSATVHIGSTPNFTHSLPMGGLCAYYDPLSQFDPFITNMLNNIIIHNGFPLMLVISFMAWLLSGHCFNVGKTMS